MQKINLKSQFHLNQGERIGILFLVVTLLVFGYVNFFVSFDEESTLDIDSPEIEALHRKIDSLRCVEIENRKPKSYPFNPNFLTDYKAYTFGMSPQSYDRFKAFRTQNKWVNSKKEFQQVTGISDSLLNVMSPYFKFPDWVTHPKPKYRSKSRLYSKIAEEEKQDLNTATVEMLQSVPGIGTYFSKRIVQLRNKLGGFFAIEELHSVWGLKPDVIEKVGYQFAVKTPRPMVKLDINTSSASDLATLPGISFELGKDIWEFVRVRDGIDSLEELAKIEQLSEGQLQLIRLYLFVEL